MSTLRDTTASLFRGLWPASHKSRLGVKQQGEQREHLGYAKTWPFDPGLEANYRGDSDSSSQIYLNPYIHTGRMGDGTGGGIGGRGGDINTHTTHINYDGQEFSVRDRLKISRDAPFNSDAAQKLGRRACTTNTRLNILRKIVLWAKDNNRPLLSSLFWIFGLAGTGKSTIAQSVCEMLEKDGLLASSYFCSLQLDSRNSKLIVPTIAFHLAVRYSIFKKHLVSKLRDDPECAFTRISSQFRDLLCVPWSLFIKEVEAAPQQPCVIVIDALDECDNGDEVLGVILDTIDHDALPGIRFLVTSRPVDALVRKVLKMNRGPQIALHEVKQEEVSTDIRIYFEEQLHAKVEPANIDQLAARAGGLFIFASTLVKHIIPNSRFMTNFQIQEKLREILQPKEGEMEVGLDIVYNCILRDALSLEEFGNEAFNLRLLVVQAVACTEQATTADVIADLLNYDVEDIISIVNSLHSLLFTRGPGELIYVIHPSFLDFIVSRAQGSFKCDLPSIHLVLSKGCLTMMEKRLKFNICNIESPFTNNDGLQAPLDSIGESLAYACQHWWAHVTRCTQEGQGGIRQRISEMMEKKGNFWIEVMTLLGDKKRCQNILTGMSETSSIALEPRAIEAVNFTAEAVPVRSPEIAGNRANANLKLASFDELEASQDILSDPSQIPLLETIKQFDLNQATQLLDELQSAFQVADNAHLKRKLFRCLKRLVEHHDLMPPALLLDGVAPAVTPFAGGGFADIYKSEWKGSPVCLKCIRIFVEPEKDTPDAIEARRVLRTFRNEVLVCRQLEHPNITPFLGITLTCIPNQMAIVSPFMVNGDIMKFMKKRRVAYEERLKLLLGAAEGMKYMHSLELCHYNIKGNNILVNGEGTACLTDIVE